MITGFKKDDSIYWHIKNENVVAYIEGEPTATAIQKVCVEKLGTYDTSNVMAVRLDKNKWAVIEKGELKCARG